MFPVIHMYLFQGLIWAEMTWPPVILWTVGLLSALLLLSGLDDCVPTLIVAWDWLCGDRFRKKNRRSPALNNAPRSFERDIERSFAEPQCERKIAIYVPCWHESDVIENMVRHNLAAIRYRNYDLFLGVYPNDEATVHVAEMLARSFRNVHVAVCPHAGPTSKADCLNWVYQRMLQFEDERDLRFDTVVMHDAEDMVHPEALALIDEKRKRYAMVQVPVLPLPTPLSDVTHGIYCDEFSEFQTIDMRAREISGSFIPSNGVGTAFAREIFERLAEERGNCIFEPTSLTEDYECGVFIYRVGFSQTFAPLRRVGDDVVATREYFPRSFDSAVRQRTRWVMGNCLQSWERQGWRGPLIAKYWFWRDRKGLATNPLSLLTNLVFAVGLVDLALSLLFHRPWMFALKQPLVVWLCFMTTALQCLRLLVRIVCVQRLYGPVFALAVPIRSFYANLINCTSSLRAIRRYTSARRKGQALAWAKTAHAYPNRSALSAQRRDLAEVLVDGGLITKGLLEIAMSAKLADEELSDYLLRHQMITDDELCEAMSVQGGVARERIDFRTVNRAVVRTLPAHLERRYHLVPFGLQRGKLLVAGAKIPALEAFEDLKQYTRLTVEFHLVTKSNYDDLRKLLLAETNGAALSASP